MKILITGGTGLIGRHLIPRLLASGHQVTVSTRDPEIARGRIDNRVMLWRAFEGQSHLNGIDAVINLAGEPIVDKRWTTKQKQRLCHSRWDITQQLVALFQASTQPPAILISGSAIGYYGDSGDKVVTEATPPVDDSLPHRLCARWEQLALEAQSQHTRVCLLRTGIVLAPDGGMVTKLAPLFRFGFGAALGDGRQYLPWIHIDDMVSGLLWLLNHHSEGPFNLVSSHPVRHQQFINALGHVLNRPAFLRVPAIVMRMLMGESAILLLGGQQALPERLIADGFAFRWCNPEEALRDLLR
ncbi:TIGR01777 family oxidoreductase [Enterobacteriaceae bacterium ESL0689]|nr:TIGR01777 family oxidoreductase [Enterobacteriaceae bacterium ESL0689]